MRNNWIRLGFLLGLLIITQTYARAADKSEAKSTATSGAAQTTPGQKPEAEQVNVDNIKEKYWARGDESEIGVVQNRLYSKEHKFELGIYVGTISSDPFLSTRNLGGSLGYHFSEYLSLHALYWKEFNSNSSAENTLETDTTAHSDINPAQYFYGLEGRASLIYGKLSLLGKAIIYYDLHTSLGFGNTHTESSGPGVGLPSQPFDATENNFTGFFGIGQQIYLSKVTSLTLDYRAMIYGETQYEQNRASTYGQPLQSRTNWSHAITLGVSFLIGVFK